MTTSPSSKSPIAEFSFEVGGISLTLTVDVDDIPTLLAWSTSEVILYLGSEGPLMQAGLRQVFG